MWSYLHRLHRKEFTLDARSYVTLIKAYYLLDSQDPESNVYKENCQSICMWCEPTKDELEAGEGFRSVLITRESQWREKLNPLKQKQCGRVGFEFYKNGKRNSSNPFSTAMLSSSYGLKKLRNRTSENKEEVAALSHCEWLRRNNVDLRHAEACLNHNMLCKSQALPIPNQFAKMWKVGTPTQLCREISQKWGPPKVNVINPDWYPAELFRKALQEEELEQERARQRAEEKSKELKEQKKKCIELLCKWGGYKKASLKLHPDRLIRMNLPEKDWLNRTETFKYLVGCKDDLQLTLTNKAEREMTCAQKQAWLCLQRVPPSEKLQKSLVIPSTKSLSQQKTMRRALCLSALATASGKIYFSETFGDGWESRWTDSC
eukprot:Skav219982  [mRNA]  locus=scaffold137:93780:98174:- [translate_table: standard]